MINEKTLHRIKKFGQWIRSLQSSNLFTHGKILIDIEADILKIVYVKKIGEEIKIRNISGMSFYQLRGYIQGVIIDFYYENERDGKPIKLDKLGLILCMGDSGVKVYLDRIFYKAKKLGGHLI